MGDHVVLCTNLSLLTQGSQPFNNPLFLGVKSLMLPLSLEVLVPLPSVGEEKSVSLYLSRFLAETPL